MSLVLRFALMGLLLWIVACNNPTPPAPSPDFAITAPSALEVVQTRQASLKIALERKNGFSAAPQFSLEAADGSALPSGLMAAFSPSNASEVTLTLSADASAAVQAHSLRIRAVSGSLSKTLPLQLTVLPAPDFGLELPATLTVTLGSSATLAVTLSPNASFSGEMALSLQSAGGAALPGGVQASFSPVQNGSSTLTLSTASPLTSGNYALQVRAEGDGVVKTAPLSLQVNSAVLPSFNLTLSPATLSVQRGSSGTLAVGLEPLSGFSAAVGLSLQRQDGSAAPAGLSLSPSSLSASGNVSLAVASTVASGTYALRLVGTAGSLVRTANFSLSVPASRFVQMTTREFDTDNSGPNYGRGDPRNMAFFAYQDGNAAWRTLSGSSGVYRFEVSNPEGRYGFVAVCRDTTDALSNRSISIIQGYLTADEASALTLCALPRFSNTTYSGIKGQIYGLNSSSSRANISGWNATWTSATPAPYYERSYLQGAYQLFATRFAPTGNPRVADKAVLLRDLNLQNPAFETQNVDFGGTSAFDTEGPYTVSVVGGAAGHVNVDYVGAVGRAMLANSISVSSSSFTYRAVPASRMRTGEFHLIDVGRYTSRYAVRSLTAGANVTLTLPNFIAMGLGFSSGALRWDWTGTTPDFIWYSLKQEPTQITRQWQAVVSRGWLGSVKTVTLSNLAGVAGWQSAWSLGSSLTTTWKTTAITTNQPIAEVFPDPEVNLQGIFYTGAGSTYLKRADLSYAGAEETGTLTP